MQERFYESGSCVQKNCAILRVHPKHMVLLETRGLRLSSIVREGMGWVCEARVFQARASPFRAQSNAASSGTRKTQSSAGREVQLFQPPGSLGWLPLGPASIGTIGARPPPASRSHTQEPAMPPALECRSCTPTGLPCKKAS